MSQFTQIHPDGKQRLVYGYDRPSGVYFFDWRAPNPNYDPDTTLNWRAVCDKLECDPGGFAGDGHEDTDNED